MLQTVQKQTTSPSRPNGRVYGVTVKKNASGQSAQKSMSGNKTEKNWIDEMTAISLHGDKTAFAALYGHFAPRVKGFLMRSGAGDSLAEETAQEVMVTVWTKAKLFDPSRASVATWIFTVARNKMIDEMRRQKRPEPEELGWGPEHEPDQADVIALDQETQRLAAAVAQLPAKQRELVEKAYFGEASHSEIAAATGLPLGTIKSRIRLALDRLRHAMK